MPEIHLEMSELLAKHVYKFYMLNHFNGIRTKEIPILTRGGKKDQEKGKQIKN